MKKAVILLFACVCRAFAADAGDIIVRKDGAYLENYTRDELQNEFDTLRYDKFLMPEENTYPRIFVQNLPKDFDAPENKTLRNQMFIQIVLPHVLKINAELADERENLLAVRDDFIKNKDFEPFECAYLEELAQKYNISTPFKDSRRYSRLLNELINRLDVIPPSLIVGAAAIDTKWGTSRIALQANNLFKTKNWYTDEGLQPVGPDADEPYRYRIYKTLEDSIRDYMHNVNSDINYSQFWDARRIARKRSDTLYGLRLVWTFALEHYLKNYAGLLDYTIVFYHMSYFDKATLEEEYDFDD